MLGVVDTAVMGHLFSPHYLGAVALGSMVTGVRYVVFGFLRMETTAPGAQAFGAGDRLELRATLGRGLLVAGCIGLAVLLAGPVVVAASARLLAPSPEIPSEFRLYVGIRLLGAPAALVNFVVLGWILGLQDSRRPLVLMPGTNGIDTVLAIAFVFGLGFHTAGVALATVIAECAGLLLGFVLIRREWQAQGGRPDWGSLMVPARFRRLLVANRDLFLRSPMPESAFLALTTPDARQGALALAVDAVLLHISSPWPLMVSTAARMPPKPWSAAR